MAKKKKVDNLKQHQNHDLKKTVVVRKGGHDFGWREKVYFIEYVCLDCAVFWDALVTELK